MSAAELNAPADSTTEPTERPVVSHLLEADEVLSPGRWGAYLTLCGAEVWPLSPTVVAQEEDSEWSPEGMGYCPECVQVAHRWVSKAAPTG